MLFSEKVVFVQRVGSISICLFIYLISEMVRKLFIWFDLGKICGIYKISYSVYGTKDLSVLIWDSINIVTFFLLFCIVL